ncbi:MAG: glycosyltransferase family 4 protein [Fibrobacter sp.]|nr:glycosyltransferase family 4 protein [Fibrobacter sp.]
MKSILIINWRDILNPEAGGAETYYHEIFKRIASHGYDVTVLAHRFGDKKEEMFERIRIIRTGNKFLFNFSTIPWVFKNRKKFDLVIEDLNKLPFFTPLYLSRPRLHMVMHFFGRAIYRETNFIFASYVYLMEKLIPLIYRKERFIAISKSTKKEIVEGGVSGEKIHIVEPGIDTSYFYQSVPKSAPPVLAYVGRLMKYKNVQFLIRALPVLKKSVPDVRLEVAGGGDYLDDLKKIAQDAGVAESVTFLGRISEEEKRDLLSRATLFVNPSSKEGWGINNIEANLCGTVSLSSDVPGLRDSVQDGITGLLYEPENIDDYCRKASSVLLDSAFREKLQNNAMSWAKSLDWDIIAGRMETILKENY